VLEAELTGHEADVRAIATVSGGRLASGSEDGTVRLWSPGSSSVVLGSHSDFVTGVTPFRQRSLASTSYDGTLRLWDLPGATSP
jgi:WD40 repeat protein